MNRDMKNNNKIKQAVVIALLAIAVVHALFTYSIGKTNPMEWEDASRGFEAFVFVIVIVFTVIGVNLLNE